MNSQTQPIPAPLSPPLIGQLGAGPQFWGPGGDKYEFVLTGQQSGGTTFVLHATVPPGGGPPPHIHTRESETYFIEQGELCFTLGDEHRTLRAGEFVHIPQGTAHTFTNQGAALARMLVVFAPAGMEGWFAEVLVPVEPTDTHPVAYSPAQLDFMIEAGPRHGVAWTF